MLISTQPGLSDSPSIKAIGTAVPPHKISQEHHYTILESANGLNRAEKLQLRKIYSHSGITSRHSVLEEFGHQDKTGNILFHPSGIEEPVSVSKRMDLYEKYAADLCIRAVKDCLDKIPSLKCSAITHLVTFSCTGMFAPGLDILLVEKMSLNRNVERTCINFMGCYGAFNGLKMADTICKANPEAKVLVVCVELCTLHFQKRMEDDFLLSNALFADGAAAVLIEAKAQNTPQKQLELKSFFCDLYFEGRQDMAWNIALLSYLKY